MATNQVASLGIKVSAHGVEKAKSGIRGIGNVAKRVKDQIAVALLYRDTKLLYSVFIRN